MPWPEPPPWTVIWTSGFSLMNCSAAASTSGCSAVEPTAVMVPETEPLAAASVPAAEPEAAGSLEPPQAASDRPAAATEDRPANLTN